VIGLAGVHTAGREKRGHEPRDKLKNSDFFLKPARFSLTGLIFRKFSKNSFQNCTKML
jgi:hypothetical protein